MTSDNNNNNVPVVASSADNAFSISGTTSNKQDDGRIEDQKLMQRQKIFPCIANILIVDDEPDVLQTLKSFLVQEGYNADTFSDSSAALQHFANVDTHYYDLVVLDIRMPKINGIQLFERLRAVNPRIKIVFASALEAAQEILSIFPDLRPENIIKKPIQREHFIQTIRSELFEPELV
jgi:CheY-like chemotaxis protein